MSILDAVKKNLSGTTQPTLPATARPPAEGGNGSQPDQA